MKKIYYTNKKIRNLKESTGVYKTIFTDFITLKFIALPEDNKVEIDFINKDDNYFLGVFEKNVDDINWYDDESVRNFVSKEIVVEVLSNYLYHYQNNYKDMGKICNNIKQLADEFESIVGGIYDVFAPNVFSQAVIDLFDL